MTKTEIVALSRTEYDALISKEELENRAAFDADDGSRIPHEVAPLCVAGVLLSRSETISTSRYVSLLPGRESPRATFPRSSAASNQTAALLVKLS